MEEDSEEEFLPEAVCSVINLHALNFVILILLLSIINFRV